MHEAEIAAIDAAVRQKIRAAYDHVVTLPSPQPDAMFAHVFEQLSERLAAQRATNTERR